MKNQKRHPYFPILINLDIHRSLVVGGGSVGFRKTLTLLEFGARDVTVMAPEICTELTQLAEEKIIKALLKPYAQGDASAYNLVFSATDEPAVGQMVKDDCQRFGILVNVADEPELCSFIMPATIKRGSFIMALSTQGVAPFFAKEKKEQFEKLLSPMVAEVCRLAGRFRQRLMDDPRYVDPEGRYELFHRFLSIDWEEILWEYGKKGAYKKMESLFD